jgi:hypothetical protein
MLLGHLQRRVPVVPVMTQTMSKKQLVFLSTSLYAGRLFFIRVGCGVSVDDIQPFKKQRCLFSQLSGFL